MINSIKPIDPYVVIENARCKALNQILFCFAVVGAVGGPLSALRSVLTGWLPMYSAHLIIGAYAVFLWASAKKTSYQFKFWSLILLMWCIGVVGLFNFGMLGAGTWWLATSALLGGMLYSCRVGVILACAAMTVTCLVAYGFMSGTLQLSPSVSVDTYMHSMTTWGAYLVVAVWLPIIIFTSFGRLSSVVTSLAKEIAATQAELYKMANLDSLTGALRPHVLEDRLEYALFKGRRVNESVGVVFIDLDNFKHVNDTYGHATGDAILVEVVARARSMLREEDLIARVGGDEFVVVITGVVSNEQVVAVAEKLKKTISRPFSYKGTKLDIPISIGVTSDWGSAVNGKQLIEAADQYMYHAKRHGRNGIYSGAVPTLGAA
ncbi:diguanylate cyclase [uncultured Zhongshania sp.]|uniref:GGDEF domain-containing protein n=1 Tax=uncultured Zhongshania sp. TaxID=1642288 RepID=UPI0030DCBBE1|tara:strand:- start:8068 stop:9198 length:1131 start_codon:yes stop_codon:yes gene_type:complete